MFLKTGYNYFNQSQIGISSTWRYLIPIFYTPYNYTPPVISIDPVFNCSINDFTFSYDGDLLGKINIYKNIKEFNARYMINFYYQQEIRFPRDFSLLFNKSGEYIINVNTLYPISFDSKKIKIVQVLTTKRTSVKPSVYTSKITYNQILTTQYQTEFKFENKTTEFYQKIPTSLSSDRIKESTKNILYLGYGITGISIPDKEKTSKKIFDFESRRMNLGINNIQSKKTIDQTTVLYANIGSTLISEILKSKNSKTLTEIDYFLSTITSLIGFTNDIISNHSNENFVVSSQTFLTTNDYDMTILNDITSISNSIDISTQLTKTQNSYELVVSKDTYYTDEANDTVSKFINESSTQVSNVSKNYILQSFLHSVNHTFSIEKINNSSMIKYILTDTLDFSNCLKNCSNNGLCQYRNTSYDCVCDENYEGLSCEINSDPCSYHPCLNDGNCTRDLRNSKSYKCDCKFLYYGTKCENKTDICKNITCSYNGYCYNVNDKPLCSCFKYYLGENCENKSTELKIISQVIKSTTVIAICVIIFSICLLFLNDLLSLILTRVKTKKSKIIKKPQTITRFKYKNSD